MALIRGFPQLTSVLHCLTVQGFAGGLETIPLVDGSLRKDGVTLHSCCSFWSESAITITWQARKVVLVSQDVHTCKISNYLYHIIIWRRT